MGGYTWSAAERELLRQMWPVASWDDLDAAFPSRKRGAIGRYAAMMGLRRLPDTRWPTKRPVHPIIKELRAIRQSKGLQRKTVAAAIGYHVVQFTGWETGTRTPTFFGLLCWCEALGVQLRIGAGTAGVGGIGAKPEGIKKPDLVRLMAGR